MIMSAFSLVAVFLVVVTISYAEDHEVSKDKMREAAMIVINDCKEKEGASDDDIIALKNHKLPPSKEGLCMMQCLFNTAKIMKDGKMDKAGAIEFCTPAMKGDAEKIKKMEEMIEACKKESDAASDGCEAAKIIAVCTATRGKEFGFVMSNPIKN